MAEVRPTLSIVVPVFNEEPGIPQLLEALRQFRLANPDISTEVVLVDDHSSDATPRMLAEACRDDPGLHYLRLTKNSGSHVAILAGMAHSQGQCAVFMAADLQDPPALLPEMIDRWRAARVVWAVREQREKISFIELAMGRVFYWLFNLLSDTRLPPTGTDFALLDRRVVKALLASLGANPSIVADIAALGFPDTQIQYVKQARRLGKSKWTTRMRLKAFADAFVGHSYGPVRAMSYLGTSMAFLGFLYALLIIILRLFVLTPIEGWSSAMVVSLIVGGVQMIMLGILGEYLWRALSEVRRNHIYIIEDEVGGSPSAGPPLAVGRLVENGPLTESNSDGLANDNSVARWPIHAASKEIPS